MKKQLYHIFLVLWIANILLLVFYLHTFILHRAYTSLEIKCFPKMELKDYPIAGSFNQQTNEIKIYVSENQTISNPTESQEEVLDLASIRTLRHERTHERQFREGRLAECDNRLGVYFNEIEAYLSEYVP